MLADDLREAAVADALETVWLGRSYYYVGETGSTNDILATWARQGAAEALPAGTVLLTDYQTAGRGRLGRKWEAPPGSSLLFSTLLRPAWAARCSGWLVMLAGLALAAAVEATIGTAVGLKWPNDLMARIDGQWRKFGGLLVESALVGESLSYAVLGVGINVNVAESELPDAATRATSLQMASGGRVSRLPLLVACLRSLEQWYERADRGESPQPEWNRRLITLCEQVSVSAVNGDQPLAGTAEGTDDAGSLLVRDAAGRLHRVVAGDVTLRDR